MNIQLIWLSSWKAYHKFITFYNHPMKIWLNCSYHGLYPMNIWKRYDHIPLDHAAVVICLVVKKTYWKIWVKVNGKDDIPYIYKYIYILWKNKSRVPNHQPVMVWHGLTWFCLQMKWWWIFWFNPPKKRYEMGGLNVPTVVGHVSLGSPTNWLGFATEIFNPWLRIALFLSYDFPRPTDPRDLIKSYKIHQGHHIWLII